MMTTHRPARLSVVATVLFGVACGAPPADEPAPAPSSSAPAPPSGELPPDHPPIDASQAGSAVPAVAPGSGTGASGLTWQAPTGWTSEPPSSSMRRAQYRLPGPAGDATCVVYYFGPGQGGDSMANARRWAMQFSQPDGSSPLDAMQTATLEVGGIQVMIIEVTGTYQVGRQMGGSGEALPDQMLLGAIAEGPDANWFFKLTGPQETVAAAKDDFRQMIESIRAGA